MSSEEQTTKPSAEATETAAETQTAPEDNTATPSNGAPDTGATDTEDRKRKAEEVTPESPNKVPKLVEGATPHTGDSNAEEANEAKIVWPEDAVLSKEDEFTFYDRVLVDDVEYKIGDCIEMWGDESGQPGFIGTIESLLTDGNENLVECCWFYRIEETIFKNNPRHKTEAREIYLSDHVDENAVEAIRKKVTVKPFVEITDLADYTAQPDSYFYKRKYNHKAKSFVRI